MDPVFAWRQSRKQWHAKPLWSPMSRLLILLLLAGLRQSSVALEVPRGGDYDEEFFAQHSQIAGVYPLLTKHTRHVLSSQPSSLVEVNSVVDVGCGHGLLVEAWRQAGVQRSYGVEGSTSAEHMWPPPYAADFYQIQNLTEASALEAMPMTDLVTTFETAEHLPPESADHFVAVLTTHNPKAIVFGSATVNQDNGMNPTHLNENTFTYWIGKFRARGYVPDLVGTASLRHGLITDPEYAQYFSNSWWYPKNVFVFVHMGTSEDEQFKRQLVLDNKLARHPKEANMMHERYLSLAGDSGLGLLWRRDWIEFASIFYDSMEVSRNRLQQWVKGEL